MPMKQLRKQKGLTKHRTIDQLEFQIDPISIVFCKKQSGQFYLYIEKGAQVLGKVDELIDVKNITYIFLKPHSKTFRIANDKNLTYQWSIYKQNSDNEEQYLQSVSFNIKAQYMQYLVDLQKREQDLYRIFYEKDKKIEIQEIWKDLKCDLIHNVAEVSCKFAKLNASVLFKITIKCDLDFKSQKWEIERERKRLARTTNVTRKGSADSKNKITEMSFYQSKQKISEVNSIQNDSFTQLAQLVKQQSQSQQRQIVPNVQPLQNIRSSQIRITDPQGVNVTDEGSQKFLSHEQTSNQDFYRMKKSTILSDIIEESYEGSSNVFSKSVQGERLKSLDQVNEDEEATPLFSPLIRTQNYDYKKYEGSSENIKRTTTLAQKTSKQFQFQENKKSFSKRPVGYIFPNIETKIGLMPTKSQNNESQLGVKDMKTSSTRQSSFRKEQGNDIIVNSKEARIKTIKKVIIAFIILLLFIFVINSLNPFDQSDKKIVRNERKKFNKSKN